MDRYYNIYLEFYDLLYKHIWSFFNTNNNCIGYPYEVFDVSPDDIMVKKKLLVYAGEHWKGFKTQLTHDYITHPSDEDKPTFLM